MVVKFFEKNYWISLSFAVIIAIFIFYVSSITSFYGSGGAGNWIADFYHFSVFFFFTAFLLIAIVRGNRIKWFLFGILFSLFYAVLDEFHQLFVPGRFASFGGILVDGTGIFLASLIYIAIIYHRN